MTTEPKHTPMLGHLSIGPQADLMIGPPGAKTLLGVLPDAPVLILEMIVQRFNSAPSLLADNERLREALRDCDRAFVSWQVGQIPGRPEDILALIAKVRAALSATERKAE